MHIVPRSSLASFVALLFVVPVQAQSPKQGDYYAPGPTTPIHATAADLKEASKAIITSAIRPSSTQIGWQPDGISLIPTVT
jgi:hypothetical protein